MEVARFKDSPIGQLVSINGFDGRFNRPFDHWAYVPNPLGDEPVMTRDTHHAVTAANRELAALNAAAGLIPNPRLLRRPTLTREAQSTSALEGTYAPIDDVLAADADLADQHDQNDDLKEVVNYLTAAEFAFQVLAKQQKITVALLAEAQKALVDGTRADNEDAGRLRRVQVVIGSPSGYIEDSRFVPMPPGADLDAAVRGLLDWVDARTGVDVDPVVAAAMAHYQFETIHPFYDGNGRIGRLMIVLQFMVGGLLSEPLLSVSPWFEARRAEYQAHMSHVSATGEWEEWVQFFALGIAESAKDTQQRVFRLLAVQKLYAARLDARGKKGTARNICDRLVATPVVTVPDLARQLRKSQQNVAYGVNVLVEAGILTPLTAQGTKNRRYMAVDVREAIAAPMGLVPGPDEPLVADRKVPLVVRVS